MLSAIRKITAGEKFLLLKLFMRFYERRRRRREDGGARWNVQHGLAAAGWPSAASAGGGGKGGEMPTHRHYPPPLPSRIGPLARSHSVTTITPPHPFTHQWKRSNSLLLQIYTAPFPPSPAESFCLGINNAPSLSHSFGFSCKLKTPPSGDDFARKL